jgi:ubiquinone/menaquinone biosynthesis C-methylase UbiE
MPGCDTHPTLYDRIGTHYDVTRRADSYILGRLIHHLRVESAGTYLDVACGTGNYSIAVANAGATCTASTNRRV